MYIYIHSVYIYIYIYIYSIRINMCVYIYILYYITVYTYYYIYFIIYVIYIVIHIYIYHFISLPSDPVPRWGTNPRRMRMPTDHWRLRAGWRRFFWGMSEKPSGFIWKFSGTPHEHTGFRRSCSFQKSIFGVLPHFQTRSSSLKVIKVGMWSPLKSAKNVWAPENSG